MDDVVLSHVVQGDQYLNSETLYQRQGEAFEVVHLDEVIQVHTQQLKRYDEVLAKYELVQTPNDILFVLRIMFVERFNKFSFDQTLLIKSFLVFQDL